MHRFHPFVVASAVAITLCAGAIYAKLIIQGTHIVLPTGEREATLRVDNTSGIPALTQAWIDGDRQDIPPEELQVPFSVTPTVMQMGPNDGTVLRIVYLKASLLTDRKPLFWPNILEAPSKDEDEDNALQFSFRLHFKLFFRPSQSKSIDSTAGKLQWKFLESRGAGKETVVQVNSPTPYYASFASVELIVDSRAMFMGRGMAAPFSTKEFDWQGDPKSIEAASIRYGVTDDYGDHSTLDRIFGKWPLHFPALYLRSDV